MISEIFGEEVSILIVLFFIAWWFKYILIDSPKQERAIKEKELKDKNELEREASNKIQHELDSIEEAKRLLPDTKKALEVLMPLYGWYQIIDTFGLSPCHLRLLLIIRNSDIVELPSLQASNFNENEIFLIKEIKRKLSPNIYGEADLDDHNQNNFLDELETYGYDSHSHEPTVGILSQLVNSNLVTTSETISNNNRIYSCLITEQGELLLKMHSLFKPKFDSEYFPRPSLKTYEEVRGFVYRMIHSKCPKT